MTADDSTIYVTVENPKSRASLLLIKNLSAELSEETYHKHLFLTGRATLLTCLWVLQFLSRL